MNNSNQLINCIHEIHNVDSLDRFDHLLSSEITKIIGHKMSAYGIGKLPDKRILRWKNMGFPSEYVNNLISDNDIYQSPLATAWLKTQEPIAYPDTINNETLDKAWIDNFNQNKIESIIAHGLNDIAGKRTSYFCFAGMNTEIINNARNQILYLVPHLHVVCLRLLGDSLVKDITHNLTIRELEILMEICVGYTNDEIALRLSLSKYTISNHIKNIFKKLNVHNRTQAVARAIEIDII